MQCTQVPISENELGHEGFIHIHDGPPSPPGTDTVCRLFWCLRQAYTSVGYIVASTCAASGPRSGIVLFPNLYLQQKMYNYCIDDVHLCNIIDGNSSRLEHLTALIHGSRRSARRTYCMHVWCVRCILQIIKSHTYKLLHEALLAVHVLAATSTRVI